MWGKVVAVTILRSGQMGMIRSLGSVRLLSSDEITDYWWSYTLYKYYYSSMVRSDIINFAIINNTKDYDDSYA